MEDQAQTDDATRAWAERDRLPQHEAAPVIACFTTERQAHAVADIAARLAESFECPLHLVFATSDVSRHEQWITEFEHGMKLIGGRSTTQLTIASEVSAVDLGRRLRLLGPRCLVVASDENNPVADNLARRLFLNPPAGAVLVHGQPPAEPQRVLVVEDTSKAGELQAGSLTGRLASNQGAEVTILAVEPSSAAAERVRQTALRVGDLAVSMLWPSTAVRVARSRSREAAIIEYLAREQHDLAVVPTKGSGPFAPLTPSVLPTRLMARLDVPLLVVNPPPSPFSQAIIRAWTLLYRVVPSPSSEERAGIYSALRRSSRGNADFFFMIVIAAALASLGLLFDSSVTVIGAMLVAPLMSPIIGVGLAVSQGDSRLLRLSMKSALKGALLSVIVGFTIGSLLAPPIVTSQMQARAEPSLLDLTVALASGTAGAYALARRGVSSALPGVAIAVALVPPLATVGLSLAMGNGAIAGGAMLMFGANFAAVAAASSIVFLLMGFRPEHDRVGRAQLFGRSAAALTTLLLVVSAPIAWLTWEAHEDEKLRHSIESTLVEELDRHDEVDLKDFALEEHGGALGVRIEIAGEDDLSASVVARLHTTLEATTGGPVTLVIERIPTTRVRPSVNARQPQESSPK